MSAMHAGRKWTLVAGARDYSLGCRGETPIGVAVGAVQTCRRPREGRCAGERYFTARPARVPRIQVVSEQLDECPPTVEHQRIICR